MLLQIPDILTADEVRQARLLLADAPWADGRDSAGPQAAQVKNNQQLPHDCDAATAIRQLVLRGVERHPLFLTAALPKKVFTPRVNRYGGDTPFYGAHVDNAIRFTANGERVRTDVSCTVFLSDPDEYEGGELQVQDTYGSRGVKLPATITSASPYSMIRAASPIECVPVVQAVTMDKFGPLEAELDRQIAGNHIDDRAGNEERGYLAYAGGVVLVLGFLNQRQTANT